MSLDVAVVEQVASVVVLTVKRALGPVLAKLGTVDAKLAALDESTKAVGELRDRVLTLEARPPIPGPPGSDGAAGKDGVDGLGFDDLSVEYDGERSVAFRFVRGDVVKTFPIAIPFLKFQGAYQDQYAYVVGDVVQSSGNVWHCQQPTTLRPGESVAAWRLMVRKGRDAAVMAGAR